MVDFCLGREYNRPIQKLRSEWSDREGNVSEGQNGEHAKIGVMEDAVPTSNLWVITLLTFFFVGAAVFGLRKGYETMVDETIYAQKLATPDSRLVAVQEQDVKLLKGEAVGDLKPRMSIADAVETVGSNEALLAPMRPASALGEPPAAGGQ